MRRDELRKRIADDLKISGFGAELGALEDFEDAGWRPVADWVYFDETQAQPGQRSIDIYATKSQSTSVTGNGSKSKTVTVVVVAEVKKSADPWVVLRSRRPPPFFVEYSANTLMTLNGVSVPLQLAANVLSQHTLFSETRWFGHGIRESFKKGNQPGFWFKAVSSVARAAILTSMAKSTGFEDAETVLKIVQPLVIFDGPLFSAQPAEGRELSVEPLSKATIFYRESSAESHRALFVDLITFGALAEYLAMLDLRIELALDEIRHS